MARLCAARKGAAPHVFRKSGKNESRLARATPGAPPLSRHCKAMLGGATRPLLSTEHRCGLDH
jgi:hypothetical protein